MTTINKIQIPTEEQVKGKKATMLIMNSIGLIVVRHVTLSDIQLKKPYQSAYYYNLAVYFTEKGKRKVTGFQYDQIAIFEGWQNVDTQKSDVTIIAEFNDNKFDAMKSKFQNLIINHNSEKAQCYLYA